MSFYKKVNEIGQKYISLPTLFKTGFNLSPMYRRSTGRVIYVSKDLLRVDIKLPISYKNRNYAGTIFGGSMFSAVDPIAMVQLINLLGKDYVVWDKSAEIIFKRPAKENLYATFIFEKSEIDELKNRVEQEEEVHLNKTVRLTDKTGQVVYCEVIKTLFVTSKSNYKLKLSKKNAVDQSTEK